MSSKKNLKKGSSILWTRVKVYINPANTEYI